MVYLEESYPGKGQPGQFLGAQERTRSIVPVKSLVQVYFAEHNRKLTYYNDRFDLREGDFVFVSGALERQRGIVCHVRTGFRVKVSDYEKVISVADTAVSGRLHMMLSHMVTFDPHTLPYEKVRTWYLPPSMKMRNMPPAQTTASTASGTRSGWMYPPPFSTGAQIITSSAGCAGFVWTRVTEEQL